jgi:hypothetical protein
MALASVPIGRSMAATVDGADWLDRERCLGNRIAYRVIGTLVEEPTSSMSL